MRPYVQNVVSPKREPLVSESLSHAMVQIAAAPKKSRVINNYPPRPRGALYEHIYSLRVLSQPSCQMVNLTFSRIFFFKKLHSILCHWLYRKYN